MASASRSLAIALALAASSSLRAQAPAPLRLSFADAVRQATGGGPSQSAPPSVVIAGFRSDAAAARVRQARSGLLPDLSLSGSWVNRSFNSKTLGFSFPGPVLIPTRIGPFSAYDGRVRLTQTIFDFSNLGRVSAAKGQVRAANAERFAAVEASAQNVALAYVRASRAQAVVTARAADSALAAELVGLAVAQQHAGVSASIDVTRAKTQLAEALGRLIVAENQLDRARIDLARALGIDPATPIALTDTLNAQMGLSDVPADRSAAVAQAVAARPDLAAEIARGAAARTSVSANSCRKCRSVPRAACDSEIVTRVAPGPTGVPLTYPYVNTNRDGGATSITSPAASVPSG